MGRKAKIILWNTNERILGKITQGLSVQLRQVWCEKTSVFDYICLLQVL